jgi:hypothetical protein
MKRAFVLALPFVVACTASLDLDRFRPADGQAISPINVTYFDVRFSAKTMLPHIGEDFEIRLVDRSNAVQAKAVYRDVVQPDFVMNLPRVVPKANAPYRLDFWADHNFSSRYDGIVGGVNEKDHAWRRVLGDPLPDDVRLVGSRYELEFIHDTAFVDIFTDLDGNKISGEDTLLPCDIDVVAPQHLGKMFELRVVEKSSGRLVGFYRQGRIKQPLRALVTGILDELTPYEVSAFVDVNDSGGYDAGDPSWKLDLTSTSEAGRAQIDTVALPTTPLEP